MFLLTLVGKSDNASRQFLGAANIKTNELTASCDASSEPRDAVLAAFEFFIPVPVETLADVCPLNPIRILNIKYNFTSIFCFGKPRLPFVLCWWL